MGLKNWLFGNNAEPEAIDVVRNDNGKLLCPRCENEDWELFTVHHASALDHRKMVCDNCGLDRAIPDGVEINA